MLDRLISGFQDGADLGAILAACRFGVPTGGWLPLGCITESGPKFDYMNRYGALMMPTADYPPRTRRNIEDSDGTLFFWPPKAGPGTRLTKEIIRAVGRPGIVCRVLPDGPRAWRLKPNGKEPYCFVDDPGSIVGCIIEENIRVLNVAGPRESSHPGMQAFVERYVGEVLRELGHAEAVS